MGKTPTPPRPAWTSMFDEMKDAFRHLDHSVDAFNYSLTTITTITRSQEPAPCADATPAADSETDGERKITLSR